MGRWWLLRNIVVEAKFHGKFLVEKQEANPRLHGTQKEGMEVMTSEVR